MDTQVNFEIKERRIIFVADPHFKLENELDHFEAFLDTFEPGKDRLILLGDVFHIWSAFENHWSNLNQRFINLLSLFNRKGGSTDLVVGNRDLFFNKKNLMGNNTTNPFDQIVMDCQSFIFQKKRIQISHGDLINHHDTKYLKLRKIVRNTLFQAVIKSLPTKLVKKLLFDSEDALKNSNKAFKVSFPENEWEEHVEKVKKDNCDFTFVGHFHPDEAKITALGDTLGVVVPDWRSKGRYSVLDENLLLSHKEFKF